MVGPVKIFWAWSALSRYLGLVGSVKILFQSNERPFNCGERPNSAQVKV